MSSVKILAICAVLILGLFAPAAMADANMGVLKSIPIQGGSFKVNPVQHINHQETIRSAVVALEPANETGTIDAIVITGPNGKREFGCSGLKVKDGTDLIQSCGGPAVLEPGETSYMAMGSGFDPNSKVILSVDLKS
ncbi:hypothetical protein [Calothrix sp. CCY 0018]|uniref:hypothetical protein n=1 Tax=Calothrix sp. CCY 0018 TaxID=3103864 RepID=UPI0039C67575